MTVDVVIVGASRHGRVVLDVLRAAGVSVCGFVDDDPAKHGRIIFDVPVLGDTDSLLTGQRTRHAFVAIGSNPARRRIGETLRRAGVRLVNAVHVSATVMPGVLFGDGVLVCPGAVVGSGSRVEDDAVINTGATVDHDSVVGAAAYLAPGVHTAGGVEVGAGAFLGIGALVGPGVRIGAGSIVGAGSVVLADLPPGVFAVGSPAREVAPVPENVDWTRILGGKR